MEAVKHERRRDQANPDQRPSARGRGQRTRQFTRHGAYLEYIMASMQPADVQPHLEALSKLPSEKRYVWRIASALKIAARNGVMLVSQYRHLLEQEGQAFGPELILRGSAERLLPILMTAVATAL